MTTEPGLADLQARTQAELAPRLMAQLQRLNWDADRLAGHQTDRLPDPEVTLRIVAAIAPPRHRQGPPLHPQPGRCRRPARGELALALYG